MTWILPYALSPAIWCFFVLGACIGSFLNVVILRVPEGTFLKNNRSVCPHCNQKIPAWLNIPIFSWVFLRGKSLCCSQRLSIQYPVVELITAIVFAIVYSQHPFLGMTLDSSYWNLNESIRFFHSVTFFSVMLACSVIDMRLMIIPDVISLPMIILSPVIAGIHPDLTVLDSFIGVLAGGGFLYLVAWLYWFLRREYGMGFGDVKLLAAIGGWLGYQAVFPTLFVGSIIGSIIGIMVLLLSKQFSWQARVPFGPFLAAGAILHLWFGPSLLAWMMM
jgi:leader peptidase (prepilin peptidase)/N-methyltransferase